MRVLLDTNILIHREAAKVIRPEIGTLFYWIDHLGYQKCIHPLSLNEIRTHKDPIVVRSMEIKLGNYYVLKTEAPETPGIQGIRATDHTDNDRIDTSLLKEVAADRVDILITEDKRMHTKAALLGIADRVYKIETFLEKVTGENPELADYFVLAIRKIHFGDLNLDDPFFDSFKRDYPDFARWFNKKADEDAYVCQESDGSILAFLYVKVEGENENYRDIEPPFSSKRRLKIGTFKVVSNGYRLGERFLRIIFHNAHRLRVDELYVTIFDNTPDQERLIALLQEWGFVRHGTKANAAGPEQVYIRDFHPAFNAENPRLTYPYISRHTHKFIVPIYPDYHTELLPDSILRNENPAAYSHSKPHRNAISKVYVSRSDERNLQPGDLIVFYRTKYNGPAYYTSVATTLGVVVETVTGIQSLEEFTTLCRKRSVFSQEELEAQWNRNPKKRPFIVSFLYIHSFPTRLNLQHLLDLGIITQAPRGFEPLDDAAFARLMEHAHADQRLIVD